MRLHDMQYTDTKGYEVAMDSSANMVDESFMLQFSSISLDQVKYEPNELDLLPERRSAKRSIRCDPALDQEMQYCLEDAASKNTESRDSVTDTKHGLTADRKLKFISEASNKRSTWGPKSKGKLSKMSPPIDDARVRAERIRIYKTDLQKLKKEKEELEKKGIESLTMKRQKIIAEKGSSASAQSSLPTVATKKPLPTNVSRVSQKGSKLTDYEPGSSSLLQRSKIRTASLGSTASKKASKITKSIDDSHLTRNKLSRSVSPSSEKKNEASIVTPDSKASMARIRRLSEPKTISCHHASSVKMRSVESVSNLKVSDGSERKKMCDRMTPYRTTAASLCELKVATSKETKDVNQKKLAAKEMTPKANRRKSSVTPKGSEPNTTDGSIPHNECNDYPVIEKPVVTLECQKQVIPIVQASEEKMEIIKKNDDDDTNDVDDEIMEVPKYAAIHAPPSPIDRFDKRPTSVQSQEKSSSYEVTKYCVETESANITGGINHGKSYQAPLARVSSLEDPSTRNSDYGKAQQNSLGAASIEAAKTNVFDSENLKLEQIPEAFEKPQVKESSKVVIRFLKLRKKSHNSTYGYQTVVSNQTNVNGFEQGEIPTSAASSLEVYNLKNLISHDEKPTAGSVLQKAAASRHFSLLSHFSSKANEKKLIT